MLNELRNANIARQKEWGGNEKIDAVFRALEVIGESGELVEALDDISVPGFSDQWTRHISGDAMALAETIKKYTRNREGIQGSTVKLHKVMDELGGVVITLDLLATQLGVTLEDAVVGKFNKTSEKHGMKTRIELAPAAPGSVFKDTLRDRETQRRMDAPAKPKIGSMWRALDTGIVFKISRFGTDGVIALAPFNAKGNYGCNVTLDGLHMFFEPMKGDPKNAMRYQEPEITINGVELSEAQAMAVRVAVTSFQSSFMDPATSPIDVAYVRRCDEILKTMGVIEHGSY